MRINERSQDLNRRSSSAWAKNALASFNISLALRNSFTSRSSAFTRSRSALVTPSRMPVSTSCLRTQSCKVWGTQPILGAMDSMAAHMEEYSPRCSSTRWTARSRTSGENLFDLFMIHSLRCWSLLKTRGDSRVGFNRPWLGDSTEPRFCTPPRSRYHFARVLGRDFFNFPLIFLAYVLF